MSDPTPHVWATAPNTPERLREMDEWMARQSQAAVDRLILTLRESAEEAHSFMDGIELLLPSRFERSPEE